MSSQPTDAAPPTTAKTRRNLVLSIAAVALLSSLIVSTQAASATGASPPVSKATIVLLHGAWADASSFAPVTERLQRDGYTVLAPPNPLRGLGSDAGYLAAFLQQRTTGPVILVGHSYGGAVISNAALADPDVKALVYVDGFVPDQGESILDLQTRAGGGGTRPHPSTSWPTRARRPATSSCTSRPPCSRTRSPTTYRAVRAASSPPPSDLSPSPPSPNLPASRPGRVCPAGTCSALKTTPSPHRCNGSWLSEPAAGSLPSTPATCPCCPSRAPWNVSS